MSSKSRSYTEMVTRVLTDAGACVMERARDGSCHHVVRFKYRGITKKFHYASSGDQRGCGIPNTKTRLRRLLRSIDEQVQA